MAIPEEDRNPNPHPYGSYNPVSADGNYYFEWTPFTPAIIAWRNAEKHLRDARDRLVDARKISGFAIAGLETDYDQFVSVIDVLVEGVHQSAAEAAKVVIPVLEVANRSYAQAADASREQYEQVRGLIDATLAQPAASHPGERQGGI